MAGRTLVAVSGGLGQPSATRLLADRLVAATERHLRKAGVEPVVISVELRDHAQDLVSNLLTGFPSPRLRETIDAVTGADGLIAVAPIYNASYSGLFKMFFDVIERDGLAGTPVLLGATGGTSRHSLALDYAFRPLFAYLNAALVPTAVFASAEDWGEAGGSDEPSLVERIDRAGRELAERVVARERPSLADPFADPTPFQDLLRTPPSSPTRRPGG